MNSNWNIYDLHRCIIWQDKRLTAVRGKKYLQVAKNRYSGDLGIVPLEFDKDALSYQTKRKAKTAKTNDVESEHDAIDKSEESQIDDNFKENLNYVINNHQSQDKHMKHDHGYNYLQDILNANRNR